MTLSAVLAEAVRPDVPPLDTRPYEATFKAPAGPHIVQQALELPDQPHLRRTCYLRRTGAEVARRPGALLALVEDEPSGHSAAACRTYRPQMTLPELQAAPASGTSRCGAPGAQILPADSGASHLQRRSSCSGNRPPSTGTFGKGAHAPKRPIECTNVGRRSGVQRLSGTRRMAICGGLGA
jgi:hypothetical protein